MIWELYLNKVVRDGKRFLSESLLLALHLKFLRRLDLEWPYDPVIPFISE